MNNELHRDIEETIDEILARKSVISEQNAFKKEAIEQLEMQMKSKGLNFYQTETPDGEIVKVTLRDVDKKKLDKTGLAEELDVEKSDLDAKGLVRLTEEGVLKEVTIDNHTIKTTKTEVKIKKRKPKKK